MQPEQAQPESPMPGHVSEGDGDESIRLMTGMDSQLGSSRVPLQPLHSMENAAVDCSTPPASPITRRPKSPMRKEVEAEARTLQHTMVRKLQMEMLCFHSGPHWGMQQPWSTSSENGDM